MTSVIIVDDDEPTQQVLKDLLEYIGLNVLATAFNGKDATELFFKLRPDVMFLDIEMPKYDGIYALEKIKKIYPNANVIIVTADHTSEIQEKVLKLGAIEIISKPFSIDDIKNVISTKIISAGNGIAK